MMIALTVLATNAAILVVMFFCFWAICLETRDVTPIDSVWALGMVVMAGTTFAQAGGDAGRKALMFGLCAVWGLRLGGYMLWRWRDHGPDRRYQVMMGRAQEAKGWGFGKATLILVFATQAPMLFIVCLPVQLGQLDAAPPVSALGVIGAGMALAGIAFESIGDWQLTRFRKNPANAGQVMDRGLWRYTRHPNYFGDALTWWGLYAIAAETGTGLWALPGPVLLTWTLMKWSGAPTIEGRMKRKKPGYEDYVRRTPAFVPWFPKGA